MSYSIDLRLYVVNPVRPGGRRIESSCIYQVSWWGVNDWCQRADLLPKRPRPVLKNDWQELEPDIPANPDQLLAEPADQLGVWPNAIWCACRQVKTT